MTISHPKVRKIIAQCERRIKKLTGNNTLLLMAYSKCDYFIEYSKVVEIVTSVTEITHDQAVKKLRKRENLWTRHLICYYARIYSGMKYAELANELGGRHHTTIISSVKKIKDLIEAGDVKMGDLVSKINIKIEQLKSHDRPPTTRTPDGNSGTSKGRAKNL